MTTVKLALFDIDGTLVRGLLILDFPAYLVLRGAFDSGFERKLSGLAQDYARRRIPYRVLAIKVPELYAKGIEGQEQAKVSAMARDFISESKDRILPYSKSLVSMMAREGFLTVAVSGSPIEVIQPLEPLGFATVFGTQMAIRNGRYTGRVKRNLILSTEKQNVIDGLLKAYDVDLARSFAFGDTEQDLPMLSVVGNPVPLNPNELLRSHAETKGWSIPKDVVSEVRERLDAIPPLGDAKTVPTPVVRD